MNYKKIIDRREFLKKSSLSLGLLLSGPKAIARSKKNVDSFVHIFYVGGPSQVDLYDYKPHLFQSDGKTIDTFKTEKKAVGGVLKAPISKFKRYGNSGQWFSDLVPELSKHADELSFLRGVQCSSLNHMLAQKEMLTGSITGKPATFGSWINYAKKSNAALSELIITDELGLPRCYPHCIETKIPIVDKKLVINSLADLREKLRDIKFENIDELKLFQKSLQSLNAMSNGFISDSQLNKNREQDLIFLSDIKNKIYKDLYSEDLSALERKIYKVSKLGENPIADKFIFSKRMLLKGTPFIQIMTGNEDDATSWDHHFNIKDLISMTKKWDFYISAFLSDLKEHGLLKSTLVMGAGEFGRTPFTDEDEKPIEEKGWGRGHNNQVNSVWLAGGGISGGESYGESDELGLYCDRDPVTFFDIWKSVFELMGIQEKGLVLKKGGRVYRPSFSHGVPIKLAQLDG